MCVPFIRHLFTLASRLAQQRSTVEQAIGRYGELAISVSPTKVPRVVRDADDDHVVACALVAQADLIVSGDKDLLTLKQHQGVAILTVAQALEKIRATS